MESKYTWDDFVRDMEETTVYFEVMIAYFKSASKTYRDLANKGGEK